MRDNDDFRIRKLLEYTNKIAGIGVYEFDVASNNLYWNDVIRDIFEVSRDFVPSLEKAGSFLQEEDREKSRVAYMTSLNTGQPFNLDLEILTAKGNQRYLSSIGHPEFKDGKCIKVYGVLQDITERKKTELEILQKNQFLNLASQISLVGYWQWNIVHNIVIWSENLYEIFGHDKNSSLTYETYFSYVHPEDQNHVSNKVQASLNDKRFHDFVHRISLKDGTVKTIKLVGNLTTDDKGNVIEMIGACQDITETSKRELELTKKNQQLAEFNHITSHNLRAPVSNLNALLDLYKMENDDTKKAFLFDKFQTVINHLTLTLNTLVTSLKIKNDEDRALQENNFEETLTKTKEILAAEILNTGAKIESDFTKAPKIEYNKIYLESIFLNLVSNAIKYSSKDRVPEIKIVSLIENGKTKLKFKDNGLGIDLKRHGHKLFGLNKVFHRNPDAKGVGLYLTKIQIEAMGGSISAQSEVNAGTTFFINLN